MKKYIYLSDEYMYVYHYYLELCMNSSVGLNGEKLYTDIDIYSESFYDIDTRPKLMSMDQLLQMEIDPNMSPFKVFINNDKISFPNTMALSYKKSGGPYIIDVDFMFNKNLRIIQMIDLLNDSHNNIVVTGGEINKSISTENDSFKLVKEYDRLLTEQELMDKVKKSYFIHKL